MPTKRPLERRFHLSLQSSLNCRMCRLIVKREHDNKRLTDKQKVHATMNDDWLIMHAKQVGILRFGREAH